jgi:ankyrin repeat protein
MARSDTGLEICDLRSILIPVLLGDTPVPFDLPPNVRHELHVRNENGETALHHACLVGMLPCTC